MTDIEKVKKLMEFQYAEIGVTRNLWFAMQRFDLGFPEHSWVNLFEWCIATDERDEAWEQVKKFYLEQLCQAPGVW